MIAVADNLVSLIIKLQKLPSLKSFYLGGGTNLALRFNHRKSIDIDLFCSSIIGQNGFSIIQNEIQAAFSQDLINIDFPCDVNDQFIFLRCFIKSDDSIVKIEIIQNMNATLPVQTLNNINLYSLMDIGLFKLMSVSNRFAKKDVYDLDYITDEIPLHHLFNGLKDRKHRFHEKIHDTIFDLDDENCPIQNPSFLLSFDTSKQLKQRTPNHSNDIIHFIQGKSWGAAKYSWRTKVRDLFTKLNIPFPKIEPIN